MSDFDDAVIIALGSNLPGPMGWPGAQLEAALKRLRAEGFRLLARSSWWRSAAWPNPANPDYLNGLAIVETPLGPRETLDVLLRIEAGFGRRRGLANDPRTLDLDLIAHGRTVMETPDLVLPHPRAAERLFVMGPLAQVAPGWTHPVLGLSAQALADRATIGLDATPT